MFISCWSVKGGSGTTVVAAALAVVLSETSDGGVVLVDLAGDLPAALGLSAPAESAGPGVAEWLRAGADVPDDGLVRIEHEVAPGLALVHRGRGPLDQLDRAEALVASLAAEDRAVVVDCGRLERDDHPAVARVLAAAAPSSFLVTRPCYLALRRAASALVRPSGIIVVDEPGRVLRPADIGTILGTPIVATVSVEPGIARAVDAGLLVSRLPRHLERALRGIR